MSNHNDDDGGGGSNRSKEEEEEEEGRVGRGRLCVEVRNSDGQNIASELYATYPTRLMVTSQPNNNYSYSHCDGKEEDEDESSRRKALTCYVIGFGGGMIAGDAVVLDLMVKRGASLVATSQSTAKVFRSTPTTTSNHKPSSLSCNTTSIHTHATIQSDGLLVLVPQPSQCFAHSQLSQHTHILLDSTIPNTNTNGTVTGNSGTSSGGDPSLLLVDWCTGGRVYQEEGLWEMKSYRNLTTVSVRHPCAEERSTTSLVFRDSTRLTGGLALKSHMRHYQVLCTVVLMGPKVQTVAQTFLTTYSSRKDYHSHKRQKHNDNNNNNNNNNNPQLEDTLLVSCGTFPTTAGADDGVVLRLAATSLETAGKKHHCTNSIK